MVDGVDRLRRLIGVIGVVGVVEVIDRGPLLYSRGVVVSQKIIIIA